MMKGNRLSLFSRSEENLKIAKLLTEGNITRIWRSAEVMENRYSVTFVGAHSCAPLHLYKGETKALFSTLLKDRARNSC
ncbi:hypothetical protein [Chroococcidiopsis sp. SAG 2025]|uniref:hypothetical protein n=1 Tax=Chroococcidiopsis sp. SAG 2025 TaxID=171389 RepID=UPI00293720EF|nr:hypothetical protein [Chroococcidiopsis sp. SAG 2025]